MQTGRYFTVHQHGMGNVAGVCVNLLLPWKLFIFTGEKSIFSISCRKKKNFQLLLRSFCQVQKIPFFLNAIGESCSEVELSSLVEDSLPLEKRNKKKNKQKTPPPPKALFPFQTLVITWLSLKYHSCPNLWLLFWIGRENCRLAVFCWPADLCWSLCERSHC